MGEEWRRGWHPEIYVQTARPDRVLVVGAGPSGLEAAMSLGKRGFEVVVVEATRTLGGRVAAESTLPGLASWRRVVDYRVGQIDRLPNVEIYRESEMDVDEALAYGFDHICVATGSTWRADGVGRWHTRPIPIDPAMQLLTPDQVMEGALPTGQRVVIFDDDHYYMGGVMAERLAKAGFVVELVTPEPLVSAWTVNTKEQSRIHRRLLEYGVVLRTQEALTAVHGERAEVTSAVTGTLGEVLCDAVVMVTARLPRDELARDLGSEGDRWAGAGLRSVRTIGDAWAPGTIASAVWWGRRYAEELEGPASGPVPFDRDLVVPST
jgi:dimethylamine/trimethylamine dehydrogenase